MTVRPATPDDCPLLADWNYQLIRDEGHRNAMTMAQLEKRMRAWLSGEYRAVLFEEKGALVAYALFRESGDEIYLRHLFVARDRRRAGLGRQAVDLLRSRIWPRGKRVTVEVLVANGPAVAFWRSGGFKDYSLAMEIMPD